MEAINTEVVARNYANQKEHPIVPDPMLRYPVADTRRCIALVATGAMTLHLDDIYAQTKHLEAWYTKPTPHHTFLVLRGHSDTAPFELDTTIHNAIKRLLVPYRVVFDQVVPTPGSVMVIGTPSVDIEASRDALRNMGYETGTTYKNNIVHMSVLRWVDTPLFADQLEMVNALQRLPKKVYATLDVTGYSLVRADWGLTDQSEVMVDFHM